MFRLDNKIAVVTGAGSGIGRAIAVTFAKQGAVVHVLELNMDSAAEVVFGVADVGVDEPINFRAGEGVE